MAALITAVMDLPMAQWPAEACEHKPKRARAAIMGNVLSNPPIPSIKPEPGDAAYPDRIIDLETGRKPKNASR